VILDGSLVYSRSLRFTGNLPASTVNTQASRDGSRAFVYPHDSIHPRLETYDLNGPLEPESMYPLLGTITLPDAINAEGQYGMAMTTTPDDSVVFVAGERKLLVIPVN
jgi:hypothetical protein